MSFVLVRRNEPIYLFIHHTATSIYADPHGIIANSLHFVKNIARRNQLKAAGYVADYHWLVDHRGEIYAGQPERMNSVHAYWDEYNNHSIAICGIGNFSQYDPPVKLYQGLINKARDVLARYPIEQVYPHSFAVNTACPGARFPWEDFMRKIYARTIEIRLQIRSEIMEINGRKIMLPIYPFVADDPYQAGGVTVAPIRDIAEGLGGEVGWEPHSKSILITNGQTVIRMQIRNDIMMVGRQAIKLPIFPFVAQGVTVAPLRPLCEALGARVTWDDANKSIVILK